MKKYIIYLTLIFCFSFLMSVDSIPPLQLPGNQLQRTRPNGPMGMPPPNNTPSAQQGKKGQPGKNEQGKQRSPRTTMGFDTTYSEDTQTYTLPLSLNIFSNFYITASIPYVSVYSESGLGNIYSGFKYSSPLKNKFGFQAIAGLYFPTSEDKLILSHTYDIQAGAGSIYEKGLLRLFVNYLGIIRLPTHDIQFGDYHSGYIGFDKTLKAFRQWIGIYEITELSLTLPDTTYGIKRKNQSFNADISGGITIVPLRLRIGVTVPIMTVSEVIDNDDRDISVDIGLRFMI